jgi:hypothetical protein
VDADRDTRRRRRRKGEEEEASLQADSQGRSCRNSQHSFPATPHDRSMYNHPRPRLFRVPERLASKRSSRLPRERQRDSEIARARERESECVCAHSRGLSAGASPGSSAVASRLICGCGPSAAARPARARPGRAVRAHSRAPRGRATAPPRLEEPAPSPGPHAARRPSRERAGRARAGGARLCSAVRVEARRRRQ